MAGDSVLAVFQTAAGAVAAAIEVQEELGRAVEAATTPDRQMRFRIGVHLGDVIEKADGSVYGDGVNIAARLQALAEPGGVTVSDAVRGAVRGRVVAEFVDQGEQQVKHIDHPVRAFRVALAGAVPSRRRGGGGGAAPARQALARRAAVHQHERRSRAGVLRRRHHRGHHHRRLQDLGPVRDRAQLVVHLQEAERRHQGGGQEARRAPRARRQRAPGGR